MEFQKLPRPLQAYIAGHVVLLAPVVWIVLQQPSPTSWPLVGALLLAAALAATWKLELTAHQGRMSVVFGIDCLALLLQGVQAAVLCAAVGAVVTTVVRAPRGSLRISLQRQPPHRLLFNPAHCAIVSAAGGLVYQALLPHAPPGWLGHICALTAFAAVYFLLNSAGISLAVAFQQALPARQVWLENFLWTAPAFFGLAFAAGGIWIAFGTMGAWALFFVPPLYLVYYSYWLYLERLQQANSSLRREMDQRQRADTALQQEREFLHAVLENAADGIVACDAEGHVIHVNRAARELCGRVDASPDELSTDGAWTLRHGLPLQRALQGETVHHVELRVLPPGGTVRTLIANGQPIVAGSGERLGAVVALHDITAREEAEENERRLLREQTARSEAEAARQRFAFLAEVSSRLASSLDYQATLEEVASLTIPQLADCCVVDLLDDTLRKRPAGSPEAAPSVRTVAVAHLLPAKQELAWEIRRRCPPAPNTAQGVWQVLRTGESLLVSEVSPDLAESMAADAEHRTLIQELGVRSFLRVPLAARGRMLGVLTLCSDQPNRYTADDLALAEEVGRRAALAVDNARLYDEARETEEELRSVTAHARCILFHAVVREREGALHWKTRVWDDSAAQQVLPLDVLPGESYQDAWMRSRHPDDVLRMRETAAAAAFSGQTYYRQEFRCRDRFGEDRWLLEDVHLEPRGAGQWHAVGVCTDITGRKRLEAELRHHAEQLAETDRRKDEFLAMLAHELRNPLAAISNANYVLERFPEGTPQAERLRSIIGRQTEHLRRLVDDLLDVSRITHGKVQLRKQPVDFAYVVRHSLETMRLFIETRRHQVRLVLPEGPIPVVADPARLEQVVTNLLGNAAKYTDPGGHIYVSVELEREEKTGTSPDLFPLPPPDSTVLLRIRDTGSGIPAHVLPRVFDLFTQADRSPDRSEGGLGIGLTLVRTLVELHGGAVGVHSDGPGKGTEFTVRLPLLKDEGGRMKDEGKPVHPSSFIPHPSQRRVLVVEDNADAAESLVELLEMWDYEVEVAASGPAAIAAAAEYRPEVVLLDIGLPGMDGYEVARRLRSSPMPAPTAAGARGSTPVLVALTGYGRDEDRCRAREAGFHHHLVKPIDPDELLRILQDAAPVAAP